MTAIRLPDPTSTSTDPSRSKSTHSNLIKKDNFTVSVENALPVDMDVILQRSFSVYSSIVKARDYLTR
jgi:hypothetical protein